MEWLVCLCYALFFAGAAFILSPLLVPIMACLFVILTIFSLNVFRGVLNGEEVGLFAIMKLFFTNYKVTLTSIIALIVVMQSYTYLGSTAGIFCVLTVALIYFNVVDFGLFTKVPEKYLSGMVSVEKANKTCSAGVIQAGGKKKENVNTKSFSSRLKQISKQLSKTN